jgi:hypothetical protein
VEYILLPYICLILLACWHSTCFCNFSINENCSYCVASRLYSTRFCNFNMNENCNQLPSDLLFHIAAHELVFQYHDHHSGNSCKVFVKMCSGRQVNQRLLLMYHELESGLCKDKYLKCPPCSMCCKEAHTKVHI